jgi:hypothetical protein
MKMLLKIPWPILLSAVLAACAPTIIRYTNNNNSTYDQWIKDRYACLQETQQRVSAAQINQYGGSSTSVVVPTCSAYNACLTSRGYFRSDDGGTLTVPKGAVVKCQDD